MADFVILADANCDLREEFQKEYDVEIIPSHIIYPGDKEMQSFLKWKDTAERDAFYALLKAKPNDFRTAPPNQAEIGDAFEKHLKAGKDILCMSISGAMSGCNSFMQAARKELLEKYPSAKISIVDSRCYGPGFGLMTVYASNLRKEGKSLDETAKWLEDNKRRFHQAGWLDDLSFVAKKGRISHSKAFMGSLVGIKPLGEFDKNGLTTVLVKAKGAKQGYSVCLDYIAETIEKPEDQIVFIAHTNRYDQAVKYKEMIEERFHPKAVYINDVFPSCSINIGPGLMAAYYVGKPLSDDLAAEKAIMERALAKK